MTILHVVDPTIETPGDKLHKINTFIDAFKDKYLALYQPRQNVVINE